MWDRSETHDPEQRELGAAPAPPRQGAYADLGDHIAGVVDAAEQAAEESRNRRDELREEREGGLLVDALAFKRRH